MTWNYKTGDSAPAFKRDLPVDLEGATVRFRVETPDGENLAVNETAEILNEEEGTVEYEWSEGDLQVSGSYLGEFEVEWDDGRVKHYPRSKFYEFHVRRTVDSELDLAEWEDKDITVGQIEANEIAANENDHVLLTDTLDAGGEDIENVGALSTDRGDIEQLNQVRTNTHNNEDWTGIGTTVDTFEDLSDWEVVEGEMEADTDNFHRGTQSMKLSEGSEDRLYVEKEVDLNLLRQRPCLSIRAHFPWSEGEHERENLEIRFREGTSGPRLVANVVYHTMSDGGQDFRAVVAGFRGVHGVYTIDDIDLTNIGKIEIVRDPVGHDNLGEWWVDNLKMTPAPSNGQLVLDLDISGGRLDDYATDAISEHGHTAWSSANISNFEDDDWEKFEELRDELGWQFGTHRAGEDGNAWVPDETEQHGYMSTAKLDLLEHGFHVGAQHRSWYQNEYDQTALDVGEDYYLTARDSTGGVAHGIPTNPMMMPTLGNMDDGLTSSIEERLEILAKIGGYGRIYGHPDDRLGESDLRDVLEKISELEEEYGLETVNLHEMYKRWESAVSDGTETFERADIHSLRDAEGNPDERTNLVYHETGEGPIDAEIEVDEDVGKWKLELNISDSDGQTEVFARTSGRDDEWYNYLEEDENGDTTRVSDDTEFRLLSLGYGASQYAWGEWTISETYQRTIIEGGGYGYIGETHTTLSKGGRLGSQGTDPIEVYSENEPADDSDLEWELKLHNVSE